MWFFDIKWNTLEWYGRVAIILLYLLVVCVLIYISNGTIFRESFVDTGIILHKYDSGVGGYFVGVYVANRVIVSNVRFNDFLYANVGEYAKIKYSRGLLLKDDWKISSID